MKSIIKNEVLAGRAKNFNVSLKALFKVLGATTTEKKKAVAAVIPDILKVHLEMAGVTGVYLLDTDTSKANYITIADDVMTVHLTSLPTGESIMKLEAMYGTEAKSIYTVRMIVKDNAIGTDPTENIEFSISDLLSLDTDSIEARLDVLEEWKEWAQSALENLNDRTMYLEDAEKRQDHVYGVLINEELSTSACIRIGNPHLHRTLPIQSGMVGGLLADDGTFTPFENQSDWTSEIRDGSAGQVMVKIPDHWRKITQYEHYYTVEVSDVEITGFDRVGEQFVSAYKATLDRTNASEMKLASVVNTTAAFRGGNNTAGWDGTYRSLLGTNATSQTMATFRTAARRRGAGWEQFNHYTRNALIWLYVIEYANLNCQLDYNSALTAEGYHQGGLGAGVTEWDSSAWSGFNSYNPFVPCGVTDVLGNGTGVVNYEVKDADDATIHTAKVNRWRGIEMFFGHTWDFVDGVVVEAGAEIDNGGTGLHKVFVAPDVANWGDTDVNDETKYTHLGNQARSDGYTKRIDTRSLAPTHVGASATTNYSDYAYQNIPTSGVSLRCVLVGGNAGSGAGAGVFIWYSRTGLSDSYASIGCRLCYIG